MKILFATCEFAPISRSTQPYLQYIADDQNGLVRELVAMGHQVAVLVSVSDMEIEALSVTSDKTPPACNLTLLDSDSVTGNRLYRFNTTVAETDGTDVFLLSRESDFPHSDRLAEAINRISEIAELTPDVVHLNDTGYATLFRRSKGVSFRAECHSIPTVLTVTMCPWLISGNYDPKYSGNVMGLSLLKGADLIAFSSRSLSRLIRTEAWGFSQRHHFEFVAEKLIGIPGSIDAQRWDPHSDPLIPVNFSSSAFRRRQENKKRLLEIAHLPTDGMAPLIGILIGDLPVDHSNLSEGQMKCAEHPHSVAEEIRVIVDTLPARVTDSSCRVVIMGECTDQSAERLLKLARENPDTIAFRKGYDEPLDHLLLAGSDFQLIPARTDIHGYRILTAMRYGSVPIVQAAAAGADLVEEFMPGIESGSGFLYGGCDFMAMSGTLMRAFQVYSKAPVFRALQLRNMNRDFSWRQSAKDCLRAYETAILSRQKSAN